MTQPSDANRDETSVGARTDAAPADGGDVATSPAPLPPAPKRNWRRGLLRQIGFLPLAITIVLGMFVGLGTFTFGYGEGASYLSDNPASCANCHIMQSHYDSWQNSSHRHVATCNACHLSPHPIGKWIVKADNGFFHSLAFTTGQFHEPLRIKPRNRAVTQNACLKCHKDFVHQMLPVQPQGDMLMCVHCHRAVGHAHR